MNTQFNEIRKEQARLDDEILEREETAEYPKSKMKIALFVELGEFMNELPTTFKHWKKTAVDDREKALEEYVDCLHFAVSLLNHDLKSESIMIDYNNFSEYMLDDRPEDYAYVLTRITHATYHNEPASAMCCLFKLGNMIRFTWDEVYNAYMKKNKVNHERQANGY